MKKGQFLQVLLSVKCLKKYFPGERLLSIALIIGLLAMPILASASGSSIAQGRVTGVVKDAGSNEPLPGVNVMWAGTSQGTITDLNGRYSLELNSSTTVLQFSYVGYLTENVDAAGRAEVSVSLVPDIKSLDELVVVGYSSQTKSSLTTAVTSLKGEDLLKKSTPDVRKALQGMVPGLSIVDQGGTPGQENISIRVRGFTSIGNTNPLVLVDGVEQSLNSVDANAIESITVLKDAASTAIYGSRGSNGVIIITTKRGSEGKFNLTYNAFYGLSNITTRPTPISTRDYMELQNTVFKNSNQTFVPYQDIDGYMAKMEKYPELFPKAFPDWSELFNWAPITKHSIVASGGTKTLTNMINLSYENQDGVIPGSGSKKFQVRSNNELRIHDKVKTYLNLSMQKSDLLKPNGIDQWYYQLLFDMSEFQNKRYPDGTYGFSSKGENIWYMTDLNYMGRFDSIGNNAVINLGTEIDIIKGLQFRFGYMVNADWMSKAYNTPRFTIYDYWNETQVAKSNAINNYSEQRYERFRTTLNSLLTYTTRISNKHDINLLAGYSEDEFLETGIRAMGVNFYNNSLRNLSQGDPEQRTIENNFTDWGLRSFFGRAAYAYDEKYFVEVNSRYDGSSRFPAGKKYTFFPSASIAWRLSKEDFWSPLSQVVNEFKLRYSYGVNGNQNIKNYTHIPQLILSNNYGFYNPTSGLEGVVTGVGMRDLASTELTWETTYQHNVGVDMAFMQNKLSLTLEFFDKVTDGILLDVPIPGVIGLNPSKTNAGIISNKGFESMVTWRDKVGEFSYSIGLNGSYVQDRIEDFGGLPLQTLSTNRYYRREGSPLYGLWGYRFDGYYVDQADIDNSAAYGSKSALIPGAIKYKDLSGPNGVPDGIITFEDMEPLGYGTPRFFYGSNINMEWKGLDFNMFWQGAAGHHVPLYGKMIEGGGYGGWTPQFTVGNYWKGPEDVDARFPAPQTNPGHNIQSSDKWLVSGSYLRLKSITLGYTLPANWTKKVGGESIRVYVNAINPITISELSRKWELDPEGSIGQLRFNYYPQIKSYNGGLVINF